MTIYLNPEIRSGLGEDTFWTWAAREFPGATFDSPPGRPLNADEVVLQYSTLGHPQNADDNTVALLWELHPEMRLQLDSQEWNEVIERTELCAAGCHRRAVSTRFAVPFYERFGKVDILPIGVDCDLFQPQPENVRQATRLLSCVPNDARVGFWMGTNHRMKGSDRLVQYARDNPDIFWIVVWKSKRERGEAPVNSKEYVHVTQDVLAGLMACSDFLLATGRLRPWFMVEWEAMAAGLPVVDLSGLEREFAPSANPRQQVIELGWDRKTARETWLKYLGIQG